MKTTTVSTLALRSALRQNLVSGQSSLADAQKEAATGRYADIGQSLGGRTSQSVSLANGVSRLNAIIDSNSIVQTRLSTAQSALESVSDNTQTALDGLLTVTGGSDDTQLSSVVDQVRNAFQSSLGAMNASVAGNFVFSGTQSDQPALNDRLGDASDEIRSAYDAAFPPDGPEPSADDVEDFIDKTVAPMFDETNWQTWSNASDDPVQTRIGTNEVIDTSTTANSEGVRKLAMASALSTALLGDDVPASTRSTVVTSASATMREALSGIDSDRSTLGVVQSRVTKATSAMKDQIDTVNTQIDNLEGVDPYDAATRVNTLMNQVETSYAITARISQLSLMNYL
ncbi:flagellar hook-associated family protein [Pararhizobium mangrovi]|uniref:Flagellin n=1 Tax=Pararhizobium mangrovi TaxID=2590452 RepID=A0A506TXV2_9HYPH|nr:flagellar hook-associated family protein [Pararhizobium mangrovi]TPW26903.1 flagellar hook-associated family protein [Pararhizobium mangrovi]